MKLTRCVTILVGIGIIGLASMCNTTPTTQETQKSTSPYPHGYITDKITQIDLQKDYEYWKNNAIDFCGDNEARVMKFPHDNKTTVSEGIAYGMLITSYMNDKQLFDKLVNFYTARLNQRGMMNWIYQNCETGDNKKNGATDADIDIAFAFLVAAKQWKEDSSYAIKASALIDSLQIHNFTVCNNEIVQKPGDDFGGCTCTNPSYYSPGYYKIFAKVKEREGNSAAQAFWEKAYADCYSTIFKNAHPVTGLLYAWTNHEGKDPQDCYYEVSGSGTYNSYQYDACRAPWRISMDYIWYGNNNAKEFLERIARFVQSPIYAQYEDTIRWHGAGGIKNVVDSYWINGLRRMNPEKADWGHRHSIPFVGSFALGAMAISQEYTDECMEEFQTITPTHYYESCLGVIYKLMATGNFWNPVE